MFDEEKANKDTEKPGGETEQKLEAQGTIWGYLKICWIHIEAPFTKKFMSCSSLNTWEEQVEIWRSSWTFCEMQDGILIKQICAFAKPSTHSVALLRNPQPIIMLIHLFSRHILFEMDITCPSWALVTLEDEALFTSPCWIHTSTIKDGCGWTGEVNISRRCVSCWWRFFQGVSWRGDLLVDVTPAGWPEAKRDRWWHWGVSDPTVFRS